MFVRSEKTIIDTAAISSITRDHGRQRSRPYPPVNTAALIAIEQVELTASKRAHRMPRNAAEYRGQPDTRKYTKCMISEIVPYARQMIASQRKARGTKSVDEVSDIGGRSIENIERRKVTVLQKLQ